MNIEKTTYDLFSKAVYHVVKSGKVITFTQIVEGVEDCFKKDKIKFKGVVEWYAITVKNDMHARGILKVFTEKGKKSCTKKSLDRNTKKVFRRDI